jgi:hypothetical protein
MKLTDLGADFECKYEPWISAVHVPRAGALVCGVLLAGLQACASLGPNALSQGRPAYNEAISATNAEQNLSWIVRMRYGLPTAQLAVSSITANVRFSTSANVDVGFGPEDNYSGNLVPLSGGVAYDENPTISYVPLQGMQHVRGLLSPVPLDLLSLLLNLNEQPQVILAVLVKRMNGVANYDFLADPSLEGDQRFAEILALTRKLSKADKLTFSESGKGTNIHQVWVHGYLPNYGEDVRKLLALLDIDGINVDGSDIVLPVVEAMKRSTNQSIAIQTRSVIDIGRIASASVDVPEADVEQGLTRLFPKAGLAGQYIHVRRAAERPATAAAATRFQDWWYYIAGNDIASKEYFLLMETLLSVQLSEVGSKAQGPVLTVPVN